MKKYNAIDFWNERKHPNSSGRDEWQPFRYKIHSNYIEKNLSGCKNVLDFGSGKGGFFKLYEKLNIKEVFTYDISESFENDIIKHGKKFKFKHTHIVKKELVPKFHKDLKVDAVICCNVLQHSRTENIEYVLKELYIVGKKIVCLEHYDNNTSKDYDCIHYRPHDYKKICEYNGWKMANIEKPSSIKQLHFVII